MEKYLSSLSRGYGKHGQAYNDYKIHFLKEIPYNLSDLKTKKQISNKVNVLPKFRKLPGTYLTEKGQMILYTKAKKAKGIEKETAMVCKNISNIYDNIEAVTPYVKQHDINEMKNELRFGDLNSALVTLKHNWFYPKQWLSPAKSLIPPEAHKLGLDIRNFTKLKEEPQILNFNISNKEDYNRYLKYFQKRHFHCALPKIISKEMKLIKQQKQNNATEDNLSRSSSKNENLKDSSTKQMNVSDRYIITEAPKVSNDNESDDQFYEADDELVIYPNQLKKVKAFGDDEKSLSEGNLNMDIKDVLGHDLAYEENNAVDANYNWKSSKYATSRNQKNDDIRLNLLKDLYGKQNFLSSIKYQLKNFGENLLNQFQQFNTNNRKIRSRRNREKLYFTLKEMKDRHDEIHLRLRKLSEKQILEKEKTVENSVFRKEWDEMLINFSTKAKIDNDELQSRMQKLVLQEELKFKEDERSQLQLEQTSIKYAFLKLKEEIIKLEEKKNEIQHFIIRLEMKRENINKIEREILSSTPDILIMDSNNIPAFMRNLREEIILLWKSKMGEVSENFKIDEFRVINGLNKDIISNSSPKEKGDDSIHSNDNKINILPMFPNWWMENPKTSKDVVNKEVSESSTNSQKKYLAKLDYEIIKHGQKISSNYTYSYFVPWPNENYQRKYIPPPSTDDDESEKEVKPKTYKLDYKRILANNPLLRKQRKHRKTLKI